LFGAIGPARGVGRAIIHARRQAEAMKSILREISTQVSPGDHAIPDLHDGAGWPSDGGRLQVPDNVTLLHLPPFTPPELQLDGKRCGNTCAANQKSDAWFWDRLHAIIAASCKEGWDFPHQRLDRIRSCGPPWDWACVNV